MTYVEVETLFAKPPPDLKSERFQTVEKSHGRMETRHHAVCHEVDWLCSDRQYPGEFCFPRLAMLGMIQSTAEPNGKIEPETRYYLCSAKLAPKASRAPCAATGGSRTACTGCWTWCSATI